MRTYADTAHGVLRHLDNTIDRLDRNEAAWSDAEFDTRQALAALRLLLVHAIDPDA